MQDSEVLRKRVRFGRADFPSAGQQPRTTLNSARRIVIIGTGDVVRSRYWPAISAISPGFEKVALCGLEAFSPLNTVQHDFFQIEPGNLLPMDELARNGYLDCNSLFVIATPSDIHVHYALQLIGLGRVAIEKPLASNCRIATLLSPFVRGFNLFCMDHYLFKTGVPEFMIELETNPVFLDSVARVEGACFEKRGFSQGRVQESTIGDVQYHLLNLMVAIFRRANRPFEVEIDDVQSAKHHPDPKWVDQVARVTTASRIQGKLYYDNGCEVRFDLAQAKAAPSSQKYLRFFKGNGSIVAEIDLSESGLAAHARALQELVRNKPRMEHTVGDAIKITELADLAYVKAAEDSFYRHGRLPSFISPQSPTSASLDEGPRDPTESAVLEPSIWHG